MKTQIVIGIGFGDEGKGITTDFLASKSHKPLVVRFSGGHQAGHTVCKMIDGAKHTHVFSQIGSGTFSGADTFWSKHCTFYPTSFIREFEALPVKTKIYLDPLAPVTTIYDVAYNRALETLNNHGSCGVGFAATIERHQTLKLYFQDLIFENVLKTKIKSIEEYYSEKSHSIKGLRYLYLQHLGLMEKSKEDFKRSVDFIRESHDISIKTETDVFGMGYDTVIFEGSQGIMLDMDFGYFPHVTRSNTTSKNAVDMITRNGLQSPEIFYVMRAYQTRHGNGPISNEEKRPDFSREIKEETNIFNDWQQNFKTTEIDPQCLEYAIFCDKQFTRNFSHNLVVTCLDQVKSISKYIKTNIIYKNRP